MKIFKLFGVAVVAVCMCVNFTACSSGDDADGGGFAGERKLVKMIIQHDCQNENYTTTYLFNYDNQGRVTEIKYGSEEYVWNRLFYWEDNTVKVMQDGGEHRSTYTIEYGLVRSDYEPDSKTNSYYSYNISDRLTRIYDYEHTDTEITWDGDKLISIVGPYDYDVTYTYDNITCKKGYHPLLSLTDFAYTNPELDGMKTNQLPISSVKVSRVNGDKFYTTYEYEFNTEGYISKIIEKSGFGYTESYTLTWK